MQNKEELTKKISKQIKFYVLTHNKKFKNKRKSWNGKITDYYVMYNKEGSMMLVLNYLLFERKGFEKRIFEINTMDTSHGLLRCNGVSTCEIIEHIDDDRKIHIDFIGSTERCNLGRGYNYMILRALEQYSLEHGIRQIYGLYYPLYPGTKKEASKFYERNGFIHYLDGYDSDMIKKRRKDFRPMTFSEINKIKVASDVFEYRDEEILEDVK